MLLARIAAIVAATVTLPFSAFAQTEPPTWHVMQDGVAFGLFNHQAKPRGGDEFRVPNWWMGMFSRKVGRTDFTINTMISLDPLTVGKKGYRELFQVGEAFEGKPLIDYQHPHDLFMQVAAVWRIPIGARTGVTFAGGPSAEPALGPVAFMHRASSLENPMSPLAHHTLDSTHIAFGAATAAVDHGPWTIEASVFNGREPDEDRWDFDFGPLDSFSGRVWFRPREQWELQVSSGRLEAPEELGHGDIVRTTASASWLEVNGEDFTAATAAYGLNNGSEVNRGAFLLEATKRSGRQSWFGRLEYVQAETGTLLRDALVPHEEKDIISALTLGAVRELPRLGRMNIGLGGALTFYAVPDRLQGTYGDRPVSFQVFLRIRPASGPMGRMWNMHMIKPMRPGAVDPHAGHHMP